LKTLGAILTLFTLWLLLSGLFEAKLVGLGFGSALVAVFVTRRMDAEDGDRINIQISPVKFVSYLMWLMAEIARANWAVTKIILARKMPIRQHLFEVPSSQRTDLAQVVFANSITLTPGTITVETEGDHFLVHAVAFGDTTSAELGDMDARVTATETGGAL
jgi:multicomponent Na+:H+ antiporter subunit E